MAVLLLCVSLFSPPYLPFRCPTFALRNDPLLQTSVLPNPLVVHVQNLVISGTFYLTVFFLPHLLVSLVFRISLGLPLAWSSSRAPHRPFHSATLLLLSAALKASFLQTPLPSDHNFTRCPDFSLMRLLSFIFPNRVNVPPPPCFLTLSTSRALTTSPRGENLPRLQFFPVSVRPIPPTGRPT